MSRKKAKDMFSKARNKRPAYADEMDRVEKLFETSADAHSFAQLLRALHQKAYDELNTHRYHLQAALRKLVAEGKVIRKETKESTTYRWAAGEAA